jgi:hypothetical protein
MNKVQKIAMVNLILAAVGLGIAGVRILIPDAVRVPRILASAVLLIICCFLVAAQILLVGVGRKGGRHYDERDKSINKRAVMIGFGTYFLVVTAASLISLFVGGPDGVMPIVRVLEILTIGGLAGLFVWAVAVLLQYSWQSEGGE